MAHESASTIAGTGTLVGARDHARSLAATVAASGRVVPAAAATDVPDEAAGATIVWAETVEGGGYSSRLLPRGTVLRIEDVVGDACVQLLVHNAAQPSERLNVADTVKVQWQAYLGTGALLLSDMGRVLMTIVEDTSERHDCLCGCSCRRTNGEKYGDAGTGGRHPNGRDLLALGLAKFGSSRRDVAPSVNLFKTVRVNDSGDLHYDGDLRPGTHVDLRAEMDVIVTLANTPHPLDDRPDYTATRVRCLAWLPTRPPAHGANDGASYIDGGVFVRAATPERRRAFENTDEYLLGIRS